MIHLHNMYVYTPEDNTYLDPERVAIARGRSSRAAPRSRSNECQSPAPFAPGVGQIQRQGCQPSRNF